MESSKSPNSSTLTRSPLLAFLTIAPLVTFHPAPGSALERDRQPASEWPSKSRRHPADRSESERRLSSEARAAGARPRTADRANRGKIRDFFMGTSASRQAGGNGAWGSTNK